MFKLVFMCIIITAFALNGCKDREQQTEDDFDPRSLKDPLIEANKHIVKTEDQHIADFVNRYGWQMNETGTGLRYQIHRPGNGMKAQQGMIAVLDYRVRLITGDVVYSSDETGYMEFVIGRGGVEAGLEEAILLMRKGDRGRFILPSYLAHGLLGDLDRIPSKATLIYEITLIDLK